MLSFILYIVHSRHILFKHFYNKHLINRVRNYDSSTEHKQSRPTHMYLNRINSADFSTILFFFRLHFKISSRNRAIMRFQKVFYTIAATHEVPLSFR